jgi:peptide/nickel transport system substrate-binding protein
LGLNAGLPGGSPYQPLSQSVPNQEDTYVSKIRRGHKVLALAAASALVFAACGSDDDNGDSAGDTTGDTAGETAGTDGGTLIWAHEQEPPDLHLDDPNNNLGMTSWIRAAMLEGLYGITAAVDDFPELLDGEAVVTENDDGTVTVAYTLREGLKWSDGEDLTADDVKWTFDALMATDGEDEDGNPNYIYLKGDRAELVGITDVTVESPTQFTMTWESFFAGWKSALRYVFPMHQFPADPAEAAAALNESLPDWEVDGTVIASSGPMTFDSWQKGIQLNMVRNDSYHGSNSPDAVNDGVAYVDGVQINFVADTDAQVNALKANEAQIIFTQPQLAFEEISSDEDFTVGAVPGPTFEQWGLNLFNKHLAKPGVREGVAFAMNKAEVMEGLYTPLFGDALPAEGLGNSYWMSNTSSYENHAGDAGYGVGDVESAGAAIEAEGYTLNGDGIYEHPEDGVLSLRVGTTGGNRLREIQQELIQAQMKDAGIEIVIDNVQGAAYFSEVPFSDDSILCANSGGTEGNCDIYDITQFAWQNGPWPGNQTVAYRSGGGNNVSGFANAEFDALADECDATVDATDRAACYNELDRYVTTLELDPVNGLVILPLTQKPDFYGYSNTLAQAAIAPDVQDAGPLANVADFQFAS